MAAPNHLQINARRGSDRLILELVGELDLFSSSTLADAIDLHERAGMLVLDITRVSFIDSTGLKAIFSARREAQARGEQFAVTRGSPQVQRLLSLTLLDEHLVTLPAADAAESVTAEDGAAAGSDRA
ncbi:MAG TPA: STAS domain-containing protein [Solirubrobacteraceae bacterium]|nr:STAS domain-containing protein [Solirubrobacteraceae bacterium]